VTTKATTASPHLFQCSHCPRTFIKRTGLGSHLRSAHGISGTSVTAIAARTKNQTVPPVVVPRSPAAPVATPDPQISTSALQCPECSATGTIATFPDTKELGKHRRFKHGIVGRIAEARRARAEIGSLKMTNKDAKLPPERTTTDNASAKSQTGLTFPRGEVHQNGFAAIDPIALALAVGSVQELCRHLAEEYDAPTRQFTRNVAELLLRQTRR
jgi:hypothetical protein